MTGGRGPWSHAEYPFAKHDARQWAAWGFDYLKYDWNPNDVPHVTEMADALRASGRDLVYSLSNSAPFDHAEDWARLANCWPRPATSATLGGASAQSASRSCAGYLTPVPAIGTTPTCWW